MTTDFDISAILPSIEVHPFPTIRNFSNSGLMLGPEDKTFIAYRMAHFECPKCLNIGDLYTGGNPKNRPFTFFYCKGNMPAEVEHQTLLGTHKHQVICSAIIHAHLHVKCNCCDEIVFVNVPEKR